MGLTLRTVADLFVKVAHHTMHILQFFFTLALNLSPCHGVAGNTFITEVKVAGAIPTKYLN